MLAEVFRLAFERLYRLPSLAGEVLGEGEGFLRPGKGGIGRSLGRAQPGESGFARRNFLQRHGLGGKGVGLGSDILRQLGLGVRHLGVEVGDLVGQVGEGIIDLRDAPADPFERVGDLDIRQVKAESGVHAFVGAQLATQIGPTANLLGNIGGGLGQLGAQVADAGLQVGQGVAGAVDGVSRGACCRPLSVSNRSRRGDGVFLEAQGLLHVVSRSPGCIQGAATG